MPSEFSRRLCFLTLSLSLTGSALAQSPPSPLVSPSATSSETKNLAVELSKAATDEEQEQLLARHKALVNSSLIAALNENNDRLIKIGDFTRALRNARLAVLIAERIGDTAGLGYALTDVGAIYIRQYRYPQALENLQKSLVIFEKTGDKKGMAIALRYLGNLESRQSRYDQALENYNRALALGEESGDRAVLAGIFNDMGTFYDSRGRYDLALESLEKSRAISEKTGDKPMLAIALNNIGIHYIDQGRYMDALENLQSSVKTLKESGIENKQGMAVRLNNIGIVYKRQGLYDQALDYYRQSLEIVEESGDTGRIAEAQNNIGVVYKAQEQYEQSLEWLGKSLKNFREVKMPRGVATSLNNIGDVYRRQGRFDLALKAFSESLRIREEVGDGLSIALTLNNLGRMYRDQGRYAEMLETSRRAAALAGECNDPEGLWNALNNIGVALRALGQPEAARQSFLDAIATLELLRRQAAGDAQQQQRFLENRLSPWIGIIDMLVAQSQYAEALTYAEQSKARVLIDALQAGRDGLQKSLSPEERLEEEEKRLQLVRLNSQLTRELRRSKPDPALVNELKTLVSKARLEFEAIETSLYAAHPELRVHRGEASIINAGELASLLSDGSTAAIEYVVADERTFLFVMTKATGKAETDVRVYTLPIKRDELTDKTAALQQLLAGRDLGFRAASAELYRILIKPAEAQLKGKTNLVIVPDDKLWDLPFQALQGVGGRFLIEHAAISYVPSLTVLREMMKRPKNQKPADGSTALLALGNPLLGKKTIERATLAQGDERLDPLPEAEQEVRALGRMYGAGRSKIYIGPHAREDRVKNEAGQAAILHFATHGTMNNASPMYSHLALAQGDTNEDGLLEAWELMRLDLKADLAVLSACETARGRSGAGEGMIGLTWALFVAGAPTTVVSQWKVESAGTRDLMLDFHRHLRAPRASAKSKMTKAEALRQAALKLSRNPETSHPFYWAGFVLVGDGR